MKPLIKKLPLTQACKSIKMMLGTPIDQLIDLSSIIR